MADQHGRGDDSRYFDGADAAAERLGRLGVGGARGAGGGGKTAGRGGKKGRGGGGGGASQGRETLISKALSQLLRHQAAGAGVELDAEGFARLSDVLRWPRLRSMGPSFEEIQTAVSDNAKQRFTMKPADPSQPASSSVDPADWLIRANQGHSIALSSEALHVPLTLEAGNIPPVVVHGTYFAFWPRIVEAGGLKPMGRTHVHFGTGLPPGDSGVSSISSASSSVPPTHAAEDETIAGTDEADSPPRKVISGMRGDAEVLVFVDVEASLRNGDMKWWISENEVVLTEGDEDGLAPLKYMREVRGRRQGVGLLWKDGEKVADLPVGIKVAVPMGKGKIAGSGRGGGGRRGGGGGRGRGRGGRGHRGQI